MARLRHTQLQRGEFQRTRSEKVTPCPGAGNPKGSASSSGVSASNTSSYLEVLTNQTNYFSAELNLAQARLNELLALVERYKALGGGWQQ